MKLSAIVLLGLGLFSLPSITATAQVVNTTFNNGDAGDPGDWADDLNWTNMSPVTLSSLGDTVSVNIGALPTGNFDVIELNVGGSSPQASIASLTFDHAGAGTNGTPGLSGTVTINPLAGSSLLIGSGGITNNSAFDQDIFAEVFAGVNSTFAGGSSPGASLTIGALNLNAKTITTTGTVNVLNDLYTNINSATTFGSIGVINAPNVTIHVQTNLSRSYNATVGDFFQVAHGNLIGATADTSDAFTAGFSNNPNLTWVTSLIQKGIVFIEPSAGGTTINSGVVLPIGNDTEFNDGTSMTPTAITMNGGELLTANESAADLDTSAGVQNPAGTLFPLGTAFSTGRTITLNSGTSSVIAAATGTTATYTSTAVVSDSGGTPGTLTIGDATSRTIGTTTNTGLGTVLFQAANTYTGPTSIVSGAKLQLGNAAAVQSSTVTVNAANGLAFSSGIGTFTLGGLSGAGNEALADTASTAVTLQIGNNNGSATYSGILSGTGGALTKLGTGTQTLSGANTYTGATTANAGVLKAGVASVANTSGAFGLNSAVTVGTNGTIDLAGFGTQIGSLAGSGNVIDSGAAATLTTGASNTSTSFSGVISGPNALTKIGTGTQTLSHANTYTGLTTVNGGTLQTTASNAIASGNAVTTGTMGTLDIAGTSETIGALTNAGTVTSSSAGGSLTFGTGSTNSGTLTGTMNVTYNQGSTAGATLGGTITNTGTLTLNATSTGSITVTSANNTGTIVNSGGSSGAVSVGTVGANVTGVTENSGTSVLTLAGANSAFAGSVNVQHGTLKVGTGTSLGSGTVTVGSTGNVGTLDLNGQTEVVDGLATAGTAASQIITDGVVTASTLDFTGSGTSTYGGVIQNGTGNVAVTVGSGTLSLGGANTYTGATAINGGTLNLTGSLASGTTVAVGTAGTLTGTGTANGNATVTGNGIINLSGAGNIVGTLGATGGNWNGAGSVGTSVTQQTSGTFTIGAGANLTTPTLNVSGGSLASGSATSTLTGSLNYTSATSSTFGGVIAGAGKTVTMNSAGGAGTLTLGGVNTYTGATTVTAGTLQLNGTLGSGGGTAISSGATLSEGAAGIIAGTSSVTVTAGTTTLAGTNTYTGATAINGGTLNLTGSVAAGSTVAVGTAGTLTGTGTANGNATVTGNGIINLSGAGNIAGTLTAMGGNWNGAGSVGTSVTQQTSGTFTIGTGANLTTPTLNVTGGSLASGSATSTLTGSLNYTSATSSTFGGVIAGTGKTVTMSGAGATLTLGGVNTYTGATSVTAGTLQLNGTLGSGGGTAISSGATLSEGAAGVIAGTSSVTVTAGTTTLAGTNSYTGATAINGGTLNLTGSVAAGSTVAVGTAGTLTGTGTANGNATVTGNGIINLSGAGNIAGTLTAMGGNWNGAGSVGTSVTQQTSGTFTIGTGANLTTPILNVSAGSLASGSATSTLTGSLNYTSATSSTFGGVIAGTGKTVTMSGAGATLTLGGVNTYTGATSVTAGTLQLNGTLGSGGGTAVSSAATLSEGAAGVIAGTSSVTVTAGTTTLAGTNSYTGATAINGGTLNLTGSLAAGSAVTVGTAGTLTGTGTAHGNATVTGNGIVNLSGAGNIAGTLTAMGGNWNGAGSVGTSVTQQTSGTFTIGTGANLTTPTLNVTGGSLASGSATSTLTGSLNYTSATSSTFGGVIAGAGKTVTMNQTGSTLTLGGVNTYTGATSVAAGTLQLNGTLGSGGGTAISSAATLSEGAAGVIAGTSSLNVTGGTTTLAGANTYTGATAINGGTLLVSGSTATGSAVALNAGMLNVTGKVGGAVTIASGATLTGAGNGTTTGVVGNVTNNGNINLSNGAVGMLTVGNLNLNGGSISFDIGTSLGQNDNIHAGTLTIGGGTTTINIATLGAVQTGTYTLLNYTNSTLPSGLGNLQLSATTLGNGDTLSLITGTNGVVDLDIMGPVSANTYTLGSSAANTRVLTNGSTTVTSTITNTGTGDVLNYTGLTATATGGGTVTPLGGNPSGTGLATSGGTASATGTFNASGTAGTVTITPTVATATNPNLGGASSTLTSTGTTTINVVNSRTFTTGGAVALGRFLASGTPVGSASVTSAGLNAVTENATVGAFTTVNGLGLTLNNGSSTTFNGAASQTANYTVTGTVATAGNVSGNFTSTVSSELGDTIAPINIAVSGTAVNSRTFSTPGAINVGRFLITATPAATSSVSSNGLNNITENATLGAFNGTGTNGLTLTPATSAFNGGTATQNDTLTLGGTAMTAGNINGTFTSAATGEFGDSLGNVSVTVTGDAVNTRTFSTPGAINLGRFLITATPAGTSSVSSTGLNNVTENATLGTFAGAGTNVTGLTLTAATSAFNGAVATQTDTLTLGGTAATAGNINGTFTSAATGEFADSLGNVSVTVTGDAVNTRTFTTPGAINLGRFLITSTPVGSSSVSSTGLNNVTENATLGAFSGTGTNGLTLTAATSAFNGGTATQNDALTLAGTAATAGNINGTFTSAALGEFGDSLGNVSVAVTGDAINKRVINNGAVTSLGTYHTGDMITATAANAFTSTGTVTTTTSVSVAGGSGTADANGVKLTGAATTFDGTSATSVNGATQTFSGTIVNANGGTTTGTFTLAATTLETGLGDTYAPVSVAYSATVYTGQGVWAGSATGGTTTWGTVGNSPNWAANGGVPGLDAAFTNTDSATFGNALTTGTATINLAGDNPNLKAITFDDTNANTSYIIGADSTGTITMNSAAGPATITNSSGVDMIASSLVLGTNGVNVTIGSGALVLSGQVSGTGPLTITGGMFALTHANIYSGGTTINGSTVIVGDDTAFGSGHVTINTGSTLADDGSSINIGNAITLNGAITLGSLSTGSLTLSGPVTGAYSLTINSGNVDLTGAVSGNTGTTISAGSLNVANLASLGGTVSLGGGSTLDYSGGTNGLAAPVTISSGTGVIDNSGGGTLTLAGTITKTGSTLDLEGGIFDVTGDITGGGAGTFNSDFDVSNGATVTLNNNANNYSGPTNIFGGGKLILGTGTAPAGTVVTLGAAADGAVANTFDLNGKDQTLAALDSVSNGGATNTNIVTNGAIAGTNTLTLNGIETGGGTASSIFGGTIENGATANIAVAITGGTHTLTGTNTYSGGTTLSGGNLVVGGQNALGTGDVTQGAGSTLSTTGTGGLLIDVGGSFVQNGGTLSLKINGTGAGSADELHVAGNATLNGKLQLVFTTTPTKGATFTILDVVGDILAADTSYTVPAVSPPGFQVSVAPNPIPLNVANTTLSVTVTSVQLELASLLGSDYTPNRAAILTYIDNNVNSGPLFGSLSTVLNASPTAATVASVADEFNPEKAANFIRSSTFNNVVFTLQQLDSYMEGQRSAQGDFLAGTGQLDYSGLTVLDPNMDPGLAQTGSRLLAWNPAPFSHGLLSDTTDPVVAGVESKNMQTETTPPPSDPFSTFVAGNVVLAQNFSQPDLNHTDSTTGGVQLGGDYRVTPHLRAGALFGYNHTDGTLDYNGSKATIDSYAPGVYVSYADSGWYANGIGMYGFDNYTEDRHVSFGSTSGTAHGAPSGDHVTGNLDGGYDFHVKSLTFGPMAGVEYTHLDVDSYSEDGAGAIASDLNVGKQQADSLRSRLGGHVSYLFQTGKINLTPHLDASWQHEFMDQSTSLSANLVSFGGSPFTVTTPRPSRDSALIDAGLNADLNRRITVFGDYVLQAGQSNYFGQSVQAGVKIGF